MFIRRTFSVWLFSIVASGTLFAADWHPLDPAELSLKQSKTDPNADAEALFREVKVLNEQNGAAYAKNIVSEYVRLKIFTERGKDFGNVQIPYFRDSTVYGVQGRTIHPDGSIVELTKDSIFEKVIEKKGFKTKVVTFALPAIEPGSIIEYKFSKNEGDRYYYTYRELEVQSSYPTDEVTFFVKPLPADRYPTMRYMPFGCDPERGTPTREGFTVLKVKNVPAFHEEPFSPPEHSAKQWILIYYEENTKSGKDKFWTALGREHYKQVSERIKVNGEIKELAAQITAGASTDDVKLENILQFCRTHIKDINGDEITTAEQDKLKANKTTIDTIRRKEGDKNDIQMAFIALAQAAGYDARRVELADRSRFLFGPAMQSAYFLRATDAAVYVGDKWKFYDVANPALPGGQLRWQEQGVYALIDDAKGAELVQTPLLRAQESIHNRFATFTLSEDGALEGDVREISFGNLSSVWREENQHTSETQREELIRKELKSRFADFDLTKLKITAAPDPAKPVGITYHLVVRNYAARTGKRLFVQPNYFAAGLGSRFPEATRYNNVYFEFPWSEIDNVELKLPPGFVLDHGDAPAGLNIPNTCAFSIKIGFDKNKNLVQYHRQFVFGDKDLLVFEAKYYPNLKKVFDLMHEADNHMLTFKADSTDSSASQ